ncbi:MAG: hypothetical protein J0M10_18460 [Chitinophagales bacterium]|nr:hypothetical protein [Chitinophagales bacterium]
MIFLLLLLVLLSRQPVAAQTDMYQVELLSALDSLSKDSSVSRHFAALYLETVQLSMQHYANADSGQLAFIRRFELAFAAHFFRADQYKGQTTETAAWRNYYNDIPKNALQLQLLGINAHINADLASALSGSFSLEELKANKKYFLRFQKGLKKQFFLFYDKYKGAALITRMLDKLPFHLARSYAVTMMSGWRKRQFRIALLHFQDPEKAARLRGRTSRRKEWTDRQVLRHFQALFVTFAHL